jgi:CxxC motif-containing protein
MEETMTCIVCPRGCKLRVVSSDDLSKIEVFNNLCKRGVDFAIKEKTNPQRTITATVKINNSNQRRLPVRTNGEIPKSKYMEIVKIINNFEIDAPVKREDIIIENVLDTGVNIIATKSVI